MIDFLLSIFSRIGTVIGSFLSGFFAGKLREKNKQLEKELKAHEIREKVEDDISRSSPSDKRLRLGKWVRRV